MAIRLALLGSTGSIGRQTLEVVEHLGGRVEVVALAANSSVELLLEEAERFGVRHLALGGPGANPGGPGPSPQVLYGARAVTDLARLPEADVVLNALVGFAGLRASEAALRAGKRLALANKESLVVGGDVLLPLAAPGQLVPVDSEHSAIFQCLQGEHASEVRRIWLTASGGPFWGCTRAQLARATREQALAHPNWSMGPKITVDSATLMNKGLEAIEAVRLFGVGYDQVVPVVHRQSIIHSMVEFADGSVKAQLGPTDMRMAIQYALSFPERWPAAMTPLDFLACPDLSFAQPDYESFGCLRLALAAGRAGGTMPCVLNAANEVAVAAFLEGRGLREKGGCAGAGGAEADAGGAVRGSLLDIEAVVEAVLAAHQCEEVEGLEHLEAVDAWARARARELLE